MKVRPFIFWPHQVAGVLAGIVGQTVAGIGSLAACLLVWTGLALAWRGLVRHCSDARFSNQ